MGNQRAARGKIAILLPNLVGGGAERVSLDLADGFKQAGHCVDIVVMQAKGDFLHEAQTKFSLIDLATTRARSVPRALSRYLRKHKPDYIVAMMWPLTAITPLIVRMSGVAVRVLIVEHGILSEQYKDWGRLHRIILRLSVMIGYRMATHRVGVSTGLVNDMADLARMRFDQFKVIFNPIPPGTSPDSQALVRAQESWGGGAGARILTVGSMKKVKNHALLMRAFAQIRHPDKRLMFVGSGVELAGLRRLAHDLNIGDKVVFAGFHSDPTAFFKTADLFVLSSDREGFGNVLVESLANGTPVVSTDCPTGPGEILDRGRFGRLVPVGDETALAEAIQSALKQEVHADELKQRAADFRPELAINSYLDLMGLR